MLKLQNFQVQLSKRMLTQPTNKLLRISVGSIAKVTTQIARFINEQSMQWAQPLSFPLLYNKQFLFQIFTGHQFGYNVDQFQGIMNGKIVIDQILESKGTWEIFNNGQPVGYLSADIVSKVPTMMKNILKQSVVMKKANPQQPLTSNQQKTMQNQSKMLRIKSIVARFPTLSIKKAYVFVQVGPQSMKTPQLRSRAGQLVYIQSQQIPLQQNYTDARIKICSLKGQGQQQVHAEGTLQLIGQKPSKKVILMKDGHQVGQVYLQSKIIDPNQIQNSSFISKANNSRVMNQSQFSAIEQSNQQSYQQPNSYENILKPRPKSISPSKSKSIDFTRLEHFGIDSSRLSRPTVFDSSVFSSSSARRRSVVNHNNNIAISKQKRFQIYQDRQNQRVSYLVDRSFQFVASKHGGRYRGASIGYGDKTDFTRAKRQNPGVGNYKLPSIWDRY